MATTIDSLWHDTVGTENATSGSFLVNLKVEEDSIPRNCSRVDGGSSLTTDTWQRSHICMPDLFLTLGRI